MDGRVPFWTETKIKVAWEMSPVDDIPDMLQTNGIVRKLQRLYSLSTILTTQPSIYVLVDTV